jgi:hypothetical protein
MVDPIRCTRVALCRARKMADGLSGYGTRRLDTNRSGRAWSFSASSEFDVHAFSSQVKVGGRKIPRQKVRSITWARNLKQQPDPHMCGS